MGIYVTGKELEDDLLNLTITRKPLIEEFLYERDILMIPAQAGSGKSIIATQIAISLSSAVPLFGTLQIPQPKRVIYLQLEGDYEESIERMRHMKQRIPLNSDNIFWFEYKMLNVMDPKSLDFFFMTLKNSHFHPDVFIIDPLYKLCGEDLADGDAAIAVVRFSDQIYEEYGCTNILIHHNHRDKYAASGDRINETNAYYGHSFIQNHVRTSYELTTSKARDEAILRLKKGRGSDTIKEIKLQYDATSMSCWAQQSASALDRIKAFANHCKAINKTIDFSILCDGSQLSHAHMRRLVDTVEFESIFTIDKSNGRKHLYIPR